MTNESMTNLLLQWYEKNGRELPWRVKGGPHPDPYVILVSEFMLQQTTVKTVIPYFHRFMARFPTIGDLAAAAEEDVYQLWQGLGYYTRARSLHKTAQMIVNEFGGRFPDTREGILKLKGIGAYTVASFMALAFNKPETVIDGNVMRIIARLYHLTAPLDEIADTIRHFLPVKKMPQIMRLRLWIWEQSYVLRKIRNACYARGRNIAGHAPLQIWNRYRFAADWRRKKNRVLFL